MWPLHDLDPSGAPATAIAAPAPQMSPMCSSRKGGGCACLPSRVQDGQTPLFAASRNGHTVVVRALLAAGACKEATDRVRGCCCGSVSV